MNLPPELRLAGRFDPVPLDRFEAIRLTEYDRAMLREAGDVLAARTAGVEVLRRDTGQPVSPERVAYLVGYLQAMAGRVPAVLESES
jgi:hypothetical protein